MFFFFFNDTATTEIYTLSLHDALPISEQRSTAGSNWQRDGSSITPSLTPSGASQAASTAASIAGILLARSEEHTSELQSQSNLVCRLLLEKKKTHALLESASHPHSTSL